MVETGIVLTASPEFVKVAETSEVPLGKKKIVKTQGKELLLANMEGKYYAIGGRCTHQGGDLSKGTLEGTTITCPRHGSKFDVTTGKAISGPKIAFIRLSVKAEPSYELRVESNDILLKAL
jgi:3-phenylpropionate/trans-cinnamate dioxygenase ferredoxin subunit